MPKRDFESPEVDHNVRLAQTAAHYLNLKASEKGAKAAMDKDRGVLERAMEKEEVPVVETPEGHRDMTLTLQDGRTRILVRSQVSRRVTAVDNIVDLLRAKLGEEADRYIRVEEVLQDNALEMLLKEGKLKPEEVQDWLVEKKTNSFIVKVL